MYLFYLNCFGTFKTKVIFMFVNIFLPICLDLYFRFCIFVA